MEPGGILHHFYIYIWGIYDMNIYMHYYFHIYIHTIIYIYIILSYLYVSVCSCSPLLEHAGWATTCIQL
jgi:hypothetical protein